MRWYKLKGLRKELCPNASERTLREYLKMGLSHVRIRGSIYVSDVPEYSFGWRPGAASGDLVSKVIWWAAYGVP